jgi:hypothetical protein
MASIEGLPPDQRAVLELVLRRGRSYDEIAQLLAIDRAGVRQRALAALDELGPQTRIAPERRALITDYLLGALPEPVAEEVRGHLSQSASERAWARAVSSELQAIAEHPLPPVPPDPGTRVRPAEAEPAAAAVQAPTVAAGAGDEPAGAPGPATSRRGGALLLAVLAAVIIGVVLWQVLPGGGHKPAPKRASRPAAIGTTGTTGTTGARVVAAINLKPPGGGKSPLGIAEVLQAQQKFGMAIAAQGLAPGSTHPLRAYAIWLYNSPSDSSLLGFVTPAVGKSGKMGIPPFVLPPNASHFQKLLVTLETTSKPKTPGQVVLEGTLTGL